ncbi:MAG: hypothetical protein KZQ88_13005, partial [Candidatus Thiodiazotropha sp. (ex Dulcina madagascariensis)]|nr:hypothetical protein [Candidatus Thiodiazotropha sp. (ex Dulcina madagascariensis)]
MQIEEKQLPMNNGSGAGEEVTHPHGWQAWLEGLIDPRHWPSLRILFTGNLLLPILVLGVSLMVCLTATLLLIGEPGGRSTVQVVLVLAVSLALFSLLLVLIRLRSQLLRPLASLEQTVNHVCQGEPVASNDYEQTGVLSGMARDIDSLSEELTDIYEDMEVRVARQTWRLAQKTTSLQVLYDV